MTNTNAAATVSTLPKHIPWVYYFYGIMNALGTTMALTHLTYFITEFTGVSITLMVSVFTVARFADLAVSMVAGAIMQRQARVRPWIVAIPTISGIGSLVCFFNPDIPIPAKLVLLSVGYCCIHFPMNFMTVSTNTLLMKIAGANPENRMAITTASLRGSSTSRIVISAVTLPLITMFQNMGHNGYFIVTLIYVIITVSGNIMLVTAGKPYEPKDAKAAAAARPVQRVTLGQMYKAAASNKPILTLLTCGIVVGIGGQVLSAGLMYYWRYSAGNILLQPVAGTVAGFVAVGTSIVCPPIARKIGKRKSQLFMYTWCALIYVINLFLADGRPYLYIVTSSIVSVGTAVSMSWGINLYLDAAEIQLHETGVDNRPFLMSLNNLPIKLGMIASGPFVAVMLNNSGYTVVDGVGQIADTGRFVSIWLGIVLACYLIALLIFFFGYKVKDEYAREAAAANAKAAQERMAAAASQS